MLKEKIIEAYKILGVPTDSSISEITKAYRKLAKEYHPDSNPKDPPNSQTMMMKINEAYETIKLWLEKGYDMSGYMERQEHEGPTSIWQKLYEKEKLLREEKRKREEEKIRKEREVYLKFWEKVVLERKHELDDSKSYNIIIKYTSMLISLYYENKFHNFLYRERPYSKRLFKDYMENYNLLIEKCNKLAKSSSSERYRKKTRLVHQFLNAFIEDTSNVYPLNLERRAQASHIFEEAVRISDRFIECYLTPVDGDKKEAMNLFKKSLDSFEYFLKTYPESTLIEYAESRVKVLEKLYRAFIKDT